MSAQSAGGKARAQALSPERRKEIAESAAKARWEKPRIVKPKKRDQMEEAKQPEPQGVVAILTGPDGYVWSTAVDFEDYGNGCGFTLKEAQEMNARAALAREVVRKAGNPAIFDAMEQGSCNILIDNLVRKKGFRVTINYIGY